MIWNYHLDFYYIYIFIIYYCWCRGDKCLHGISILRDAYSDIIFLNKGYEDYVCDVDILYKSC